MLLAFRSIWYDGEPRLAFHLHRQSAFKPPPFFQISNASHILLQRRHRQHPQPQHEQQQHNPQVPPTKALIYMSLGREQTVSARVLSHFTPKSPSFTQSPSTNMDGPGLERHITWRGQASGGVGVPGSETAERPTPRRRYTSPCPGARATLNRPNGTTISFISTYPTRPTHPAHISFSRDTAPSKACQRTNLSDA